MARNKDITYNRFQSYVKNKDVSVNHIIDNCLTKTQSMFVYDGLPDTMPQSELEHILQTAGHCFVTEVNGSLYALSGNGSGEPDAYGRPTQYIVANPYLKLNKTYDIESDGVLFKNDYYMAGLLPLIGKYAVLLTDSSITLNTVAVLTRITMLITASDDKTKQSADNFVKKILDGDFSVIGENAFFKGITMHTQPTGNATQLTQLIELVQYYKANLLNELGLNANYNMKRERLNLGEVGMNTDTLLPFVDNMFYERTQAVQKINEKFGTEIAVKLGSAWYTTRQAAEDTADTDDTTDTTPTPPDTTDTTDTEETTDTTVIEDTEETTDTDRDDNDPDNKDKDKE